MTETAAPPPPRKPWIIVLPVLVLLALAIVWSAFWVYAANRAEREIDAWIKREARLGRVWTCPDRSLGGFPFRFELKCREPSLETRGGDPFIFTSASAHAVADVWAPNHIVAEFQGPAKVEDKVTGETYDATWSLLQMSGVGDLSGRPQRFSLQVHDPVLTRPSANGAPAAPGGGAPNALATAKMLEFHVRRSPAADGVLDGVDYAFGLKSAQSPALAQAGATGPLDVTVQGTVTAAADLRPMPVEQRMKAWAAAGGVARLDRLVLTTPTVAATASGQVSLDGQGRLNGKVDLGFAGVQDLITNLAKAGIISREFSPIVGALAMAGRKTTVEGRQGVSFPLRFKDGVLQLGPVPVGIVPPLF